MNCEVPAVGSLCTGYGGLDMAVERVFGAETVWHSEVENGPDRLLAHHHPNRPNIGDLTQVNWSNLASEAPVEILTAGYPCQPFSIAGKKQGANDDRHIWPGIAEGIRVLRPRLVVLENVANHVRLGLDAVLGDLAALGYDAAWGVFRASEAGAPHRRERVYVVAADPTSNGRLQGRPEHAGVVGRPDVAFGGASIDVVADPGSERQREQPGGSPSGEARRDSSDESVNPGGERPFQNWGPYLPAIRRWERVLGRPAPNPSAVGPRGGKKVNPAFAEWMMGLPAGWVSDVPGISMNEALKLCGNGVVPQQAEMAIRHLWAALSDSEGAP